MLTRVRDISKTADITGTAYKIEAIRHMTSSIGKLHAIAKNYEEKLQESYSLLQAYANNQQQGAITGTSSTATTPSTMNPATPMAVPPGMPSPDTNGFTTQTTATTFDYAKAIKRAEQALESVLYTSLIAHSCPNADSDIKDNKSTALTLIEEEVVAKMEESIKTSDTLYESAAEQSDDVQLHRWVKALFESFEKAKNIAENPALEPASPLPAARPAAIPATKATDLEKQLKRVLLNHCPEGPHAVVQRQTSRTWTWDTVLNELYFYKKTAPTNVTATSKPSPQKATANAAADTTTPANNNTTDDNQISDMIAAALTDYHNRNHKRNNRNRDDNPSPHKRGYGNGQYKSQHSEQSVPCRDFARDNCTRGPSCRFSHKFCKNFARTGRCHRPNCSWPHINVLDNQPRTQAHRRTQTQSVTHACRNWTNTGTCSYGNNCKFAHDQTAQRNNQSQSQVLANVINALVEQVNAPSQQATAMPATAQQPLSQPTPAQQPAPQQSAQALTHNATPTPNGNIGQPFPT